MYDFLFKQGYGLNGIPKTVVLSNADVKYWLVLVCFD